MNKAARSTTPIPDDLHDLYVKSLGGLAFISEYENEDPVIVSESWTSLIALIERTGSAESTNAALLSLLERHHAASIVRDGLLREGMPLYVGTDVYLKTEAAIKRAKEKV